MHARAKERKKTTKGGMRKVLTIFLFMAGLGWADGYAWKETAGLELCYGQINWEVCS